MNTAPFPSSHGELYRHLLHSPVRCLAVLALTLLLAVLPAHRVSAATGGPDAFGYTFTDSASGGVSYGFEDISATGTLAATVSSAQDATQVVPVGFTFSYYGNAFSSCNLVTHGHLTFGAVPGAIFSNAAIPNAAAPNNMIAG